MIYDRLKHWQFLEDELKAEVDEFNEKLNTSASYMLLETAELFTAQFLSFNESGEMICKLSRKRPTPRKGEYLYCMTLHKELRNYKNWGDRTYGDLVKDKTNYTEAICIWMSTSNDPDFILAGFKGVDFEFAEWIKDTPGVVLVLGPNRPPYEYLAHLQQLVLNNHTLSCSSIIDQDFEETKSIEPILLDGSRDVASFIDTQLNLSPVLALQGPPGTGKTYQIAKLCKYLCAKGNSVLVTALTNRALMEVAGKSSLSEMIQNKQIYKTKITSDESKEIPLLQFEKDVTPKKGCIVLATFFISSGVAAELAIETPFDYVIVDEASQALLAMLGAARFLGKQVVFVGDTNQLPPVVQLKKSKIRDNNYLRLVEGLDAVTNNGAMPLYQLTESFRLCNRAVSYTNFFYNGNLSSKSKMRFTDIPNLFFMHKEGGPSLIKTDMGIGDLAPESALKLTLAVVASLVSYNSKMEIAVLSCMRKTVRELQKTINSHIKNSNLIIDTIARVQGLTTDVCIFVIPNTNYLRSLEPRLFNVATSRSIIQTIIISDKEIFDYSRMNINVRQYLEKLEQDYSFYCPYSGNNVLKLPTENTKIIN